MADTEKVKNEEENREELNPAQADAETAQDEEIATEECAAEEADNEAAEDAAAEPDGSAEASDGQEKESFFGKRKKNKKDPKDEKIEELTDRYTRLMAEFENFRKRTDKEKAQKFEMGAKSIIESILPVVDSFENGLKSIPDDEKESPVAVGMDKIYKQLMTALEKDGVTVIEAAGQEFDPNLHNAMMTVEDTEGIGSNMVAMELQKGYKYRDQVVRHSMVSVTQ